MNVLVLETDAAVQALLEASLRAKGLQVLTGSTGIEGIAHLSQGTVDLLVTGLHLEGLDGFGLFAVMGQHSVWSQIPVIVVSNDAGRRSLRFSAPIQAVFGKPFDVELFQTAVLGALGSAGLSQDEAVLTATGTGTADASSPVSAQGRRGGIGEPEVHLYGPVPNVRGARAPRKWVERQVSWI